MTRWLVTGLVPQRSAVLLLGELHSSKAWLTEQLALSVASGSRFLDIFEVQRQPVILIDEDSGTASFKRRLHRLARGLKVDLSGIPLECYSRCNFLLWDAERRIWLRDLIRRGKGTPLVIIDSLRRIMAWQGPGGGDVMTGLGEFCHELRDAGATLLIVHQVGARESVGLEDWDVAYQAPGFVVLVECFDMALSIYRVPTARTEFVLKPLERRVELKVRRPFSIALQEDEEQTWAKLAVTDGLPELGGEQARRVLPEVVKQAVEPER